MSAALIPTDPAELNLEPPRHKFTRDEVQELADRGFFEGRRFELIDGDLIDKMGQKPPHAIAIRCLLGALARIFDPRLISVQLPMEAAPAERDRSLPEPDVVVLREWQPEHSTRFPEGNEVLLAIEVSDSTLGFDLNRKARLYARSGVGEYWVLDIRGRRILAHRQHLGEKYEVIKPFKDGDLITLEGRSETIAVSDLLPPVSTAPNAPDTAQ